MIDVLLGFAKKAGSVMKEGRKHLHSLCNKDQSVSSLVTTTDIAVSDLFARTIKKHFSHLKYMIIDEETISKYGDDVFKAVDDTEYQFAIDPVDGTVQYAYGHPLYGVSIGIYKNARPYMGLIYLPELNELIYCDAEKVYRVDNAFKRNEIRTEITAENRSYAPIIFMHPWLWNMTKDFSTKKALLFSYYSAVSSTFYTLTGQARACGMYCSLWDMAGAWPIAQKLGLFLREHGNGKIYDKISADLFKTDMSQKKHCLLCKPDDYEEISSLIEPRL